MQSRETQITLVKWTNADGQTKRANERSFVYRPPAWRRWGNVKTTYWLALKMWGTRHFGSENFVIRREESLNGTNWYRPALVSFLLSLLYHSAFSFKVSYNYWWWFLKPWVKFYFELYQKKKKLAPVLKGKIFTIMILPSKNWQASFTTYSQE